LSDLTTSAFGSERIGMINTILFVAVIVLMLVLLALFVVILMEYRAKKSYDHYVMQSEADADASGRPSDHSVPEETKRTIPNPNHKENEKAQSGGEAAEENRALLQENGVDEQPDTEPLFKQFPPQEEPKRTESGKADGIRNRVYEPFTHSRLVESMGLSPEEADEFVLELIHQLEGAIEELDEKIKERDFEEIEHITHGLKGAALNIGSGGVADILVDYNTQMKHERDIETALAYQDLLRHAVSDLKIEYSQVA